MPFVKVIVEVIVDTDEYADAKGRDAVEFAREVVDELEIDVNGDVDAFAVIGAQEITSDEYHAWLRINSVAQGS